jgi:hypothetical protein
MLVLRRRRSLPLRRRREVRRVRLVHRPLPLLREGEAMTAPTGELVCRLLEALIGRRPREVEFAARAAARETWLIRSWFDDGSRRDHRLRLVDGEQVEPGEQLTESAFDRWPPAEIRGAIRRCRC